MSEADAQPPADQRRRSADREPVGFGRILAYFLKLGAIGFGGPIATVGYMQRDLVEQRQWMDRQDFLDGVALGQTMPGPLAAQVAMWVGYLRRGALGAAAVAAAFVAPSFAIVVAVGAVYSRYSGSSVVQALFYGIAPAVMAIITIAAIRLVKLTDRGDWRLWGISAAVFALTALTGSEPVLVIVGAGLLMILLDARPRVRPRRRKPPDDIVSTDDSPKSMPLLIGLGSLTGGGTLASLASDTAKFLGVVLQLSRVSHKGVAQGGHRQVVDLVWWLRGLLVVAIAARYKGYRYPIEVIGHAVWLYHRFALSLRDVEELMLARGVVVTYETIRCWCAKFGPDYAAQLRRRQPRPGDKWHFDEVFVKINGTTHYLWRAVDQHGNVLDILVQSRRNAVSAKRFFRKLLKGLRYVPRVIVTDKLASYQVAHRELLPSVTHRRSKYLNNRAENSHQPTRVRERVMKRFASPGQAQRFLFAFGIIRQHFRPRRHLISAPEWRTEMTNRFADWNQIISAAAA